MYKIYEMTQLLEREKAAEEIKLSKRNLWLEAFIKNKRPEIVIDI